MKMAVEHEVGTVLVPQQHAQALRNDVAASTKDGDEERKVKVVGCATMLDIVRHALVAGD